MIQVPRVSSGRTSSPSKIQFCPYLLTFHLLESHPSFSVRNLSNLLISTVGRVCSSAQFGPVVVATIVSLVYQTHHRAVNPCFRHLISRHCLQRPKSPRWSPRTLLPTTASLLFRRQVQQLGHLTFSSIL